MWRSVASILCGLVAWAVVVTLLNFGLRAAIPGYHAAEATLDFTLAMKVGRLIEAALATAHGLVCLGADGPIVAQYRMDELCGEACRLIARAD